MEEVVENLNHLCWNVIENSRMNVVPFKSVRCTHELETVEEKEANVFLDVWPPTFSCGCVANAGDGRLSRRARRMPSRAQIEELLKYLEENPPPLSADQTTTNPDPYIERWLQAAERIHESDGEDVPDDVVVVEETEEESEDDEEIPISDIEMIGYQFEDYRMDYIFEPGKTYHFHVQAFLHGHMNRYISGQWHPSLHKLYCMSCMRSVNRGRMRAGEPLKFIGEAFNLTSDENGTIVIPYWFRPGFFLSDSGNDQVAREDLMDLIASMVLPRFSGSRRLRWEFHCSFCWKNLFTECVSDVTLYAIEHV